MTSDADTIVNRDLGGTTAVVTGGGRNVGRAICEELAAAGARVVVADIDLAEAEHTATAIGSAATALQVDVSDHASVSRLRSAAVQAFGKVDLLVNNAATISLAPTLELSVEEWDRVMAVNARGVFLCSQAFAQQMVRNGGGNIVTIASISGKEGDVQNAHYSASKAAAINFTQTLAKELAGANVRVNAICPGTVATPMSELFATSWGTTVEDVAAEYQLIKRPQHPREIAAAVLFVATMPSITGQAINVDGGAVFH